MRKLRDILADQDRPDERDLRSRSDRKRARRQTEERLSQLARDLVGLSAKKLEGLGLPEAVLDAVRDAKTIESHIARDRQLRIVRRTLREADAEAIEQQLRRLVRPDGGAARRGRAAERWAERLIEGGDEALGELLTAFPEADRTRLRQSVRAASTDPGGTRQRRLIALLTEILSQTTEPAGPTSSGA